MDILDAAGIDRNNLDTIDRLELKTFMADRQLYWLLATLLVLAGPALAVALFGFDPIGLAVAMVVAIAFAIPPARRCWYFRHLRLDVEE